MGTTGSIDRAEPGNGAEIITERYRDDDDAAREPLLRTILARMNVSAIAYPTLGYRDVLQVFLLNGDDLVFACVLVAGARLREMLAQSSPVIEGFTLQVLSTEHLSMESVRAGVQSWVERCFPRLALPNLTVERWTGPEGLRQEVFELLLQQRRINLPVHGTDLSTELPDPEIAQPPYESAA